MAHNTSILLLCPADEENLLVLFNHAHKPDQVQTALDLLRWDKMVRARQQMRYKHFSPAAIRMLLKVSCHMPGSGLVAAAAACRSCLPQAAGLCVSRQLLWE